MKTVLSYPHHILTKLELDNIPDDFPNPNDFDKYWHPPQYEYYSQFNMETYLWDVDEWFKKHYENL